MERFYDVCECCESRELEFVLFDVKDCVTAAWVKDMPGFRCRSCEEVSISEGVIEVFDELLPIPEKSIQFPIGRYQRRVLAKSGIERELNERLLHAWSIVRLDGRSSWEKVGSRAFGEISRLAAK